MAREGNTAVKLGELLIHRSPSQNYWTLIRRYRSRRYGDSRFSDADLRCDKYTPTAEVDRFERYRRVIRHRHPGFVEPRFESAVVLELGCGPLLGLAPVAVFRGAATVYFKEPRFSWDVVKSDLAVECYWRPLHHELVAQFEPGAPELADFDWFLKTLFARCREFDGTDPDHPIDFVYSNSVLEHVPESELRRVLRELRRRTREDSRFIHAVDFSNHLSAAQPFRGIYDRPPPSATAGGRPLAINLLRLSDIQRLLDDTGFPAASIVYRRHDTGALGSMDPYWRRYSPDELGAEVVLYVTR